MTQYNWHFGLKPTPNQPQTNQNLVQCETLTVNMTHYIWSF